MHSFSDHNEAQKKYRESIILKKFFPCLPFHVIFSSFRPLFEILFFFFFFFLNNSEQLLRSFRRKERSYTSIHVNVGQEERGRVGAITTSNVKPFITRTPLCMPNDDAAYLRSTLIPFDYHLFFSPLFFLYIHIYKFRHEVPIKSFYFFYLNSSYLLHNLNYLNLFQPSRSTNYEFICLSLQKFKKKKKISGSLILLIMIFRNLVNISRKWKNCKMELKFK